MKRIDAKRIDAKRMSVRDSGSCNFCNADPNTVTVIRSTQQFCHIVVRICDACLNDLKEVTA